jgi:hypothetical protein
MERDLEFTELTDLSFPKGTGDATLKFFSEIIDHKISIPREI